MNNAQLNAAMVMAQNPSFRCIDDNGQHLVDISCFDGFGLDGFKTVVCTTPQIAALIRWQCFQTNGNVDAAALQEIADAGRHKFTVVGN